MNRYVARTILMIMAVMAMAAMMAAAAGDTSGPAISAFSFSPATVDTTSGPQTVTLTITVTDNLSGFRQGSVFLRAPGSGQYQLVDIQTSDRTSGDASSGVYERTFVMPQYSDVGNWYVDGAGLYDTVGNATIYSRGHAVFGAYTTLVTQ